MNEMYELVDSDIIGRIYFLFNYKISLEIGYMLKEMKS